MSNAVIYARFSSSGQREESIEGQVRECREYALRKGYTIIGEYADKAMTGTNDKRPDFQRMIHDAEKKQFQIVICWKHDRFARNRYDAALYKAKLKKSDVTIEYAMESVPEGAQGIIIDSIMEGYAEYYSANLSENVKRGLYDSALKRLVMGQVCYGLVPGPDGRFAIEESQAVIVRRIFSEYIDGKSSRQIIEGLNNEGYRTRLGHKWNYNAILQMISNPKYKGVYQYADIYDENGIPAIVSKEVWDKANEMAASHHRTPHAKNDEYVLTGKLFCGHCGEMMIATGGYGRSGKYYAYYACKNKNCDKKNVGKDYIENAVLSHILEIVQSDAVIDMFADKYMEWQKEQSKHSTVSALERRLQDIDKALGNLIGTMEKGLVSETLTRRVAELEEERNQVKRSIGDELINNPELERDDIVEFLTSFRNGDIDSPKWKRWLLNTFINRIYLYDDGKTIIQLNYYGDGNVITINILNDSFEDGSYTAQSLPPNSAKTNIIIIDKFFLLQFYI